MSDIPGTIFVPDEEMKHIDDAPSDLASDTADKWMSSLWEVDVYENAARSTNPKQPMYPQPEENPLALYCTCEHYDHHYPCMKVDDESLRTIYSERGDMLVRAYYIMKRQQQQLHTLRALHALPVQVPRLQDMAKHAIEVLKIQMNDPRVEFIFQDCRGNLLESKSDFQNSRWNLLELPSDLQTSKTLRVQQTTEQFSHSASVEIRGTNVQQQPIVFERANLSNKNNSVLGKRSSDTAPRDTLDRSEDQNVHSAKRQHTESLASL